MISYIKHDEEFYFLVKLITGEELVGKGFAVEEDGLTQIFVTDPIEINCITKTTNNSVIKGVVMNKWMQFSDEDFFILNEKDIISIGGLSSEMIHMYNLFLKKSSQGKTIQDDIEENKVELDNEMGYISSVEDARRRLEKIFKAI